MAPGCLQLSLVGVLSVSLAVGAGPLEAQSVQPAPSGAWTVEFSESPGDKSPTFRSEPQPVTVREAMGAVLVTAESFRLLTDLTESRLAGCQSTRPDLPDARIQPDEIADRIGSLALAVFEEGQVSFTFRTTTNGTEYAITMNGTKSGAVQVSRAESGELVLSATGAPLSVIRDRAEMFTCAGAADFTIRLTP
jgi:hypothetical protein